MEKLAAEPGNLSSSPRTYLVERKKPTLKSCPLPWHVHAHVCTYAHMHTQM